MPAPPAAAELFPGYRRALDRVETGLRQVLSPPDESGPFAGLGADCPDRLRAAMRHSLLAGGKRLRPVLTLACHDACRTSGGRDRDRRDGGGSDDAENALRAAVAVELVHTYSLIHDDLPCMDDDDLRRGRPTCHVAFDEATAVLAGDALLTLAFAATGAVSVPSVAAGCTVRLANAAGALGMVAGQVADLEAEAAGKAEAAGEHAARTGEQLEAIHRRKTGALIAAACTLGGCVAEADAETLAGLEEYGASLGLAFQIADDLLDLSASSADLGKTAGKDVAAGKLTYPALYGEEGSRRRAANLVERAVAGLGPLGEAADPLRALARYAVERDR
ncbi:polyprenyl synthetase family protein [Alienimonas sp. DA493]|uniref:polyprenyl synthetase family protein n=1 Tax=Alienimonas sp. DA493 TaxID=3373605 RepID=UPI003753F2EC